MKCLREPVSVKPGADFTNIEFMGQDDRAKRRGLRPESIKERVLPYIMVRLAAKRGI